MSCRFDSRHLPAPIFDPPQSEGGECGLISLWQTEAGNRAYMSSAYSLLVQDRGLVVTYSLRAPSENSYFSEGEKRRPEMRMLFAGQVT